MVTKPPGYVVYDGVGLVVIVPSVPDKVAVSVLVLSPSLHEEE